MHTLLLSILLCTAPPEFELRTLDGRTLSGPLTSLDATQVTVQTAGGPVSLGVDKLMAVAAAQKPTPPAEAPTAWVELIDGSSLLGRDYAVSQGRARIVLADGLPVEMPVASVASVRLQEQSEQLAAEWARILEMEAETDVLVVRKGQAIDYYRGLLRDVTDQIVHFELDGNPLRVKRAKVHGLVYYRPPAAELPQPVCRLTDSSGSQWSVGSLAMPGEVQWTTCGGLAVSRPAETVAKIDFSGGKIVYLSDLKPESVTFTPYFGTSRNVPMLAKLYAPRNDTNLESGPLRLDENQYSKGLALHSRTEVVYRLPGRFSRLKAIAGIDRIVRPQGNVRLVISGDEKVLLEQAVTGTDPPKPIELDLTGVRRLKLLVDFGENLDVGDHLDLCQARVVK